MRGYIRSLERIGLSASYDDHIIIRKHIADLAVLATTARCPIGESKPPPRDSSPFCASWRKSTKLSCRTRQRGEWWIGKRLALSARAVLRAANSPGAFLNRAHDRLASILLAIVTDGPSIVGKSLEVEYRLAPRRPEVAAHPIGDHVLPLGV